MDWDIIISPSVPLVWDTTNLVPWPFEEVIAANRFPAADADSCAKPEPVANNTKLPERLPFVLPDNAI